MQSYMLTLSKKQEITFAGPLREKTDYKILRELYGISARLSRKILLMHQEMLSFTSINIIARHADTATTRRMASSGNYIAIDCNNRCLLPLYLIMRVLINKMKSENTPFLLKSERFINEISIDVNLFFCFVGEDGEYKTTFTQAVPDTPCMILEGFVRYDSDENIIPREKYINKMLSTNPLDIILSNTASHPQYPGELGNGTPFIDRISKDMESSISSNPVGAVFNKIELEEMETIKQDYEAKKKFAELEGCCLKKPKLFTIIHVFCDSPQHQVSSLLYPSRRAV